jgi:hypothetical protein
MNASGVIYILLLLPESLNLADIEPSPANPRLVHNPSKTRSTDMLQMIRCINPLRTLYGLIPPEADRLLRHNIIVIATLNTLIFATVMGSMGVIMMYSEYTFKWNNQASGAFLSSANIARTVALVVLLPLAIRLFNRYFPSSANLSSSDVLLIRISIFADVIGYMGYALAPTGALFTISGVIASLDSIALATSEAALSKLAGTERMGEVLGSLGFLQACARILGPTIANLVYSTTVEGTPGIIFWGFVSVLVIAGVGSFAAEVEKDTNLIREDVVEEGSQLEMEVLV